MLRLALRLKPILTGHLQRQFCSSSRLAADQVRIVEVGPRDGLQNEKSTISLETKIELIKRLAKTGVTHMEAGSFVPAKWVPQVGLSGRT
jgi:hydroxymethylglutaryl-CoA lyase